VSDASVFGSKAVGLGQAVRCGLPVPPGVALSGELVEAIAADDGDALAKVAAATGPLGGPLAVRSSAVDEDGAEASFAGQHLTLLNVSTADELGSALRQIWWSANSDSAITYRKRVGLITRPSIAVVVQVLLDPECAGVMFTRNPITGADERLIEASWGLGEAVVAGLVAAELVEQLCLDDARLADLNLLAGRCEEVYGPDRDVEWAIAGSTLYLLQCRAVTRVGGS
jgi:pyruvate,water dikinase